MARDFAKRPSVHAVAAVLLLVAGIAACVGTPRTPRSTAPIAAEAPRRVILISLDGAGAHAFQELHRQGVLDQGGFERFFREGEVADALIPVNPTLTATNHVSLVTGFPPAATGIVGNEFHAGGPLSAPAVSALEAPIETETLWEAARRRGRRVGVLTWPGADGRGERRTASWGLIYTTAAELGPQILTLSRSDWQPTPPLARVQVGSEDSAGRLTLDLAAVDSKDDAETAFDAVAVRAGQGETAPLHAGAWGRLAWGSAEGRTASWIKLLALAPDLSEVRLYFGGSHRTRAYPDDFAEALARAAIYWPGSPDYGALVAGWKGRPGIDLATWIEQAEHMAAFSGEALRFAATLPDWDLLLCYIPIIDIAGHGLLLLDDRQPDFSPERRRDFTRARQRVWQAVDAELRKLLAELDLTRTTVVVVSDHGMVPVHTAVDPNALLVETGVIALETPGEPAGTKPGGPAASAIANGGAAFVYVDAGEDAAARASLLDRLARLYSRWQVGGEAPIDKVLTRREAARIGLDHPHSGDLVLFARKGFTFRSLPSGTASAPAPVYGAHGYLASDPTMQAVYMAVGAGIKPRRGGTVHATDIAPRVATWLGIDPPRRHP